MKNWYLFHLQNIALAVFWSLFIYANFVGYLYTGKIALLFAAIDATLVTALFLIRKRPRVTSRDPVGYGVAFASTFFLLLLRPSADSEAFALGTGMVLTGLVVVILSLVFLGRSFGIVPALRDIKTSGPYAFVRHPIYAGHMLCALGYLAINPSLWNVLFVAGGIGLLFVRISIEEEFLKRDEVYRRYMHTTKYRLFPLVY